MKITKYIVNICLIVLTLASLIMSGVYLYYHTTIRPTQTTIGTTYIGDQSPIDLIQHKDNLSEEQIAEYENRVLFESNYYSNDNDNGIVVQELMINYFTDNSLSITSCRGTGMQYLGDITTKEFSLIRVTEDEANSLVNSGFYYYDKTDSITWNGGKMATQLNRNTPLIIKIDNSPYLIQLDGTGIIKDVQIGTMLGFIPLYGDATFYYTYINVFQDIMTAIKSNSMSYGDYYITLDLSEYFTNVKVYNEETGKFDKLPEVDITKNYSYLKFHYDANGLTKSLQSLFGSIALDTKYGTSDTSVEYWSERVTYNLNETTMINNQSVIKYRYSEVYGGYFASLNLDIKNLFLEMPRTKVNITLDLNNSILLNSDINVIGIDYNGFEDFEIDTLTIKGSGNFYILDKAFNNSKIQTFKYSNQLFLDISDTAFNNEYVEVVL